MPKLKKGIKSGSFVLTILHKNQNETLGNVERKKRIKWAFKPAKKLQKNIDKAFLWAFKPAKKLQKNIDKAFL